jgi:hypothetical protein
MGRPPADSVTYLWLERSRLMSMKPSFTFSILHETASPVKDTSATRDCVVEAGGEILDRSSSSSNQQFHSHVYNIYTYSK